MRSPYVLLYVTSSGLGAAKGVHAVLTADPNRTACGLHPAGPVDGEPGREDICPDCWADWRVRGDDVRVRLAGRP